MESFAAALNYGIPIFVILIAIEFLYGHFKGNQTIFFEDTIASLSSGIINTTKAVLGLIIAIISYTWVLDNFAINKNIEAQWWMFPLVFIAKDFAGYWVHRFEHMVNYFWNRHSIHHSSEEFNLPCALRQSVSEIFGFSIFILFPLAIIGVPVEVFGIVAAIHLFAQFWYHTRHINKMGFLEYVIVTPSHHRVHHAINEEYLDKNFAQIFIVWDKWFGTFQEELESTPPVYGVKRQANSWNPIIHNFHHAALVWKDFFRTKSIKDKFRIWFMPTGFRPADVAAKYPVKVIEDAYKQVKYQTNAPFWLNFWSFFQLIFALSTALFLFNNLATFGESASFTIKGNEFLHTSNWVALLLGAFIFLAVFSYTTIMDIKKYGAYIEIVKSFIGIAGIYWLFTYFNFNVASTYFLWILLTYQFICLAFSFLFILKFTHLKTKNVPNKV